MTRDSNTPGTTELYNLVVDSQRIGPLDEAALDRIWTAALTKHAAERRYSPRRRMVMLLPIAAVVALACVGVAVAASPILSRIWDREAGTARVERAQLGRELNMSQTVGGSTVTLERGYADANRIVVGYSTQTTAAQDLLSRDLAARSKLIDASGREYPLLVGQGYRDLAGLGASVLSFDATQLDPTPGDMTFTLTVGSTGAAFQFTLPVLPAKVIEVNATASGSGLGIKLVRVRVTPSEVTALMSFAPPNRSAYPEWAPIIELAPTTKAGARPVTGSTREVSQNVWVVRFPQPADAGDWTLTMTELVGMARPSGVPGDTVPNAQSRQQRIAGPWRFAFTIP